MKKDYFILAWKNLKRRGIRSWLTLLGIFIGIMAVVSLISLGDGLKTAVNSQFGVGATEIISVQAGGLSGYGPPGTGVVNPLTKKDAEEIDKLDSVEIAIGRIIETLKLNCEDQIDIVFAASVPEGDKGESLYEFLEIEAEYGRLLQDGDDNAIILGNDFANPSKKTLSCGKLVEVGDVVNIQNKNFKVVGIMKKKGSFIIDQSLLLKEDTLRDLVNNTEDLDLIVVKAKNKEGVVDAKEDIEDLLRERRDVEIGEEDFEVSTPEASLATVNSILTGVQIFIVLIASISIIVGALGIINTMTTSVLERIREIGIMKAIGAKNSDIFFQFFIEAGLLGFIGGLVGTIFGVVVGFLGVNGINSFLGTTTEFQINWILILGTLLGSFIIGSISGIAPAMKAAKMNPVEALRK